MSSTTKKARQAFRDSGGTLRTREALKAGLHPRTLYAMRDAGDIEQIARGLFRLRSMPALSNPDLAIVASRVPRGVVCLISALAFHELTTQVPHEVHLALPRTARHPRLKYPPMRIYQFSTPVFETGIETHQIDGVSIRVYGPEKTIADCFKYRNKIGLDVAIEALRMYRRRRGANLQKILEFARVCRVEKVVRPYLEASA